MIYSSDGQRKDKLSCGLDRRTNNQVEILGLLKSCQIAWENGIKEIQVFGDSEILIKKNKLGRSLQQPNTQQDSTNTEVCAARILQLPLLPHYVSIKYGSR